MTKNAGFVTLISCLFPVVRLLRASGSKRARRPLTIEGVVS